MPNPIPDTCPHCGNDSPAVTQNGTSNVGLPVYAVICPGCGIRTTDQNTMAAAAAIWDARPADSYLIHDWDAEVDTYLTGSLVAFEDALYAGLEPKLGSAPGVVKGEWMLLAN